MNTEVIEYIILIISLATLILLYCFYVINDENKKIKYYKKTISYDTEWKKYNDMVHLQKKIILKKQTQLFLLNILVFLKGVVVWKK